jgi:hypothetical protein
VQGNVKNPLRRYNYSDWICGEHLYVWYCTIIHAYCAPLATATSGMTDDHHPGSLCTLSHSYIWDAWCVHQSTSLCTFATATQIEVVLYTCLFSLNTFTLYMVRLLFGHNNNDKTHNTHIQYIYFLFFSGEGAARHNQQVVHRHTHASHGAAGAVQCPAAKHKKPAYNKARKALPATTNRYQVAVGVHRHTSAGH